MSAPDSTSKPRVAPERFMARALELAARGKSSTHPNPRVGCVIVRNGEIVGEGWHRRAGEPHAEINALAAAGECARGADIYVTLEPCNHHGRTPPCVDALVAARVRKVVAAMEDPDPRTAGSGFMRLRKAGITLEVGLCEAEARALNRGFVSRIVRGRPWVSLKLAASLDGRTAMASGESRWITGPEARADAHRLRAEAGAVLVGADTVLADDPQLNVRDWTPDAGIEVRVPDRIVVDGSARVPLTARVWNDDGARRFWLVADSDAIGEVPPGVERLALRAGADWHVDLSAALRVLAQHGVGEVLVEAGPTLAGALLQAEVVDEMLLYIAPTLLGHAARPLAMLPGVEQLADRLHFHFGDVQALGRDLRICLRPEIH